MEKNAPSASVPRIRLLYLIGQLGRGGSERQLYLLLRHIDLRRFECSVIVFNPSPNLVFDDALRVLGVRVRSVPGECRSIIQRILFLYREIRELSPHIVHSWSLYNNPYAGFVGRLAGVPVCFGSLRGAFHAESSVPWFYRKLACSSVHALLVNSAAAAVELEASGYPSDRIDVLPNCVEATDDRGPVLAVDLSSLGLEPRHVLVGIVGNLRSVKNHLLFVAAMAKILPRYPEAMALVIGQPVASEPDLPDRITAAICEHGLQDRFVLTGFLPDVSAIMSRLTIFCLTSHSEGMPNAVLEAMAAGRPIVATRVGGVPEIVRDGENGFLVEPGDVDGFARAVERLLRSPDLARELGARGCAIARARHDCIKTVKRLESFYAARIR